MNTGEIRKIFKNVYFFSVFTKLLGAFFGFWYSIIVARYLGPELKGQLSYINSITGTAVIVFSLGVHQSYPYYKRKGIENIKCSYVHSVLIMSVTYMLIATELIFIPGIIQDFRVKIATILIPIMVFSKLITYLIMIENPNKKNKWEMYVEVAEVIFLLLFYLFTPGSLIICVCMIAAKNLALCLYFMCLAHENIKISLSDFKMLKEFLVFGFFPMLSLLMNNLNYRIDVFMLGSRVIDSEIGIYSIGIGLAEKVWLLSDSLRDVLYSKLIKGKGTEEVNKVIRISITACSIVIVGLIMLGKPFIVLCYGQAYSDAYYPLLIVLFGTLVMVYYKVIQAYNIVHHKQKRNFIFLAISVVVNVVLNIIMIPVMGIHGAALASLASYTVCAAMFIIDYIKFSGSRIKNMLLINRDDIRLVRGLITKK